MAGGVLQSGNDWSIPGVWSTAGIPIDGDNAFMDSDQHITSGMASAKVGLGTLKMSPQFAFNLGQAGGPLLTVAALLHHLGSGDLYLDADTDASQVKMDKSYIRPSNPNAIVQLGSNTGDPADWEDIEIESGIVTLNSTIRFSGTSQVLYNPVLGGSLTLLAGMADALPTLDVEGGTVVSDSVVTLMNIRGGADVTQGTAACTTVNVRQGIMRYNHTTCTTFNVWPGATLDFTGTNKILGSLGTINLRKGANLVIDQQLHSFTAINHLGV